MAREAQTELVRALRKFKTKQFLSEHKGNAISNCFLSEAKGLKTACVLTVIILCRLKRSLKVAFCIFWAEKVPIAKQ